MLTLNKRGHILIYFIQVFVSAKLTWTFHSQWAWGGSCLGISCSSWSGSTARNIMAVLCFCFCIKIDPGIAAEERKRKTGQRGEEACDMQMKTCSFYLTFM